MKKYLLLSTLFISLFTANCFAQNKRGGIFTDEQWKQYDMVKRWMDSSQSVTINSRIQKQLDEYCAMYPQNKSVVFRYTIFIKAMLNEKFSIDDRIEAANYTKQEFKSYIENKPFPVYIIDGIVVELNKLKSKTSTATK